MFQSRGSSVQQQTMYPIDHNSAQGFPFGYQSNQQMSLPLPNGIENPFSANPMNGTGIRRNPSIPLPSIDGFVDSMTQVHIANDAIILGIYMIILSRQCF